MINWTFFKPENLLIIAVVSIVAVYLMEHFDGKADDGKSVKNNLGTGAN